MEIEFNKKIDHHFKDIQDGDLFIHNGNLYIRVECCTERFDYNAIGVGSHAYVDLAENDVVIPVIKISVEH